MNKSTMTTPHSTAPLISVLMPVYNGEAYLESAVESVLGQTYPHFEFIIIDDGSSDKTSQILQHYADTDFRIKVIRQNNAGIVSALNCGLKHCKGMYIARMDADDICYPERFEIQLGYLEADKTIALIGGQADIIDGDGHILSQQGGEPGRQHRVTNMRPFPPKVADSLHPLVMFRDAAIKAIEGYRSDFPHAEDYDMFIRISSQGRIYNPKDFVLKYRVHSGSVSQKHMALQESSATSAELVAKWALRKFGTVNSPMTIPSQETLLKETGISQAAYQTYQNYRLWKRTHISHLHSSHEMRRKMLRAVLTLHPRVLFDQSYWQIRIHILATFVYRWIKRKSTPYK